MRVLTLVTGGIATKFLENLQPLELPEGSYYAGIKDIIEKQEENISFGMKPEVLAEDVRRRVERGETGKVWVAGGATLIKWFIWLVPQWGTVSPWSDGVVVEVAFADVCGGRIACC